MHAWSQVDYMSFDTIMAALRRGGEQAHLGDDVQHTLGLQLGQQRAPGQHVARAPLGVLRHISDTHISIDSKATIAERRIDSLAADSCVPYTQQPYQ